MEGPGELLSFPETGGKSVKLRGVAERGAVRFVAPAVFFLTRGPAGILGRGLADILGVTGKGKAGETSGEEWSSR